MTIMCFLFALLSTQCVLNTAQAKDFGTHGMIYPIAEEDPIALIQNKLKGMAERGELEQHNKELQKKTRASVERPQPVEGILKATKGRVFYVDPTYVLPEDLKDHTGKVFAKKGTKINPLETVVLSHTLLFFDGDDEDQKTWARARSQCSIISDQNNKKIRLVLTKGAPLILSKEFGVPVYFDQGGLLTKKLGIKHVPALVTQEGLQLRIEEMHPSLQEEGVILERPQVKRTKTQTTKTGCVSKTSYFDKLCSPLPEERTL